MEMSSNTAASILLLLFLTRVPQTTASASLSEASRSVNTTLLFNRGSDLQNCSCSAPVRACDEALAASRCRCHSVPRSALLPPAGLRAPGPLAVWVKELWVLEELLNRSVVGHLLLSFCGIKRMDSQYLALLGLQTLRIHSAAPEAPYPDQEITISPATGVELETLDFSSSYQVTFLDVAVLNGLSVLKAYSVLAPPAQTLSQHFPHLAPPFSLPTSTPEPSERAAQPLQNLLITFVY